MDVAVFSFFIFLVFFREKAVLPFILNLPVFVFRCLQLRVKNIIEWLTCSTAIQAAQLMLTNQRDAFISQSRSPNIVPFHMLDIVSYCAIVTFSFSCYDNPLQKCRDLEIGVRGHSRSLKVAQFDRLCMVSY